MFNELQYWEKAKAREFTPYLRKDKHPAFTPEDEPYCTRSQYIVYLSHNREFIAGVHQYLRPDGTLEASGKPDPKRILAGGQIFAYSPRKSPQ